VAAARALNRNLDLLRLNGQRHPTFRPHFQASGDGFADVGKGFIVGVALADTAGDGRAFGDPNAVLIPVKCSNELPEGTLTFAVPK